LKFAASAVALLVLLVLAIVALKLGWALAFLEWVRGKPQNVCFFFFSFLCVELGNWGMLIMILAFIVASFPVPFLFGLFTVSSGVIFGLWKGLLTAMIGCAAGSILVFIFARYLFREKVEQSIQSSPFFLKFNGRIEKEGWKLALAMRLASVPFGFVNVFLAITKLKFEAFVLTTLGGEVPIAFIGCFIGHTIGNLSEAAGQGGGAPWTAGRIALFCVEACLAITFFVVALLVSKNMIKASMDEANADVKGVPLSEEDHNGNYELPPIEILHSREGADAVLVEPGATSSDAEVIIAMENEEAALLGPKKTNESFGDL
jgi:uncharacterized membrane protein YdjX (TVP38/TMEM64 family)